VTVVSVIYIDVAMMPSRGSLVCVCFERGCRKPESCASITAGSTQLPAAKHQTFPPAKPRRSPSGA
jgi:hypothetical protein